MTLATPDQLIAQRVLVRDMPDRSRIVATLRIEQYGGNTHPHFSATAEVYEPRSNASGAVRSRRGLEADIGGCVHGAILGAFPGAAQFVAMHLSDYPTGEPMHAESNARYYLTGKAEAYELEHYGPAYIERLGTPAVRCARALRLESTQDLPHDLLRVPAAERDTPEMAATFTRFVDAQRDRWAREARAAHDLLELMPTLYELRGYGSGGDATEHKPLPSWLIGADPELVNV